jgi:acyl-CoA thioester hydrolase
VTGAAFSPAGDENCAVYLPYTRKTQFFETDAMGIIHHSNYIRWFEEGRVEFMQRMGFDYARAHDLGIDLAVTGIECQYRAMTRFGETVIVWTRIKEFSPARMTVGYRVTDSVTNELRALGESGHCYISAKTGRPVSLKKALPELYALFLSKKAEMDARQ